MLRAMGKNAPPPIPCTALERMSSSMFWAAPEAIEPAMNITRPRTKNRLLPYRSESFPKMGIATVWARMYALKTHA